MADVVELRMNVAALKRFDPYARDIVDSATHVALYTFEDNEWEKTSIEGALFVYSRNGKPFHSMLIMNRLNTRNLIEPVTEGLELQVQEPFLLYRNSKRVIYGIWFFDKEECVRVSAKLDSLARDSSKANNNSCVRDKMPKNQQNTLEAASGGSVDIFSMLSKAQDDYNINKGIKTTGKNDPQTPRPPDVASQSVMDFFAKAGGGNAQMPSGPPPQASVMFGPPRPPGGDAREGPMILQRLMSNPVHSVEHIEKQQRSVTPGESSVASGAVPMGASAPDSSSKRAVGNNGFKLKGLQTDVNRKNNPAKSDEIKHIMQAPPRYAGKPHPDNSSVNPPPNTNGQTFLENDLNFMRGSSPKASSPLATFLNQSQSKMVIPDEVDLRPVSAPIACPPETPQKPALMPPTMFTSSASKAGMEKPALDTMLTPIKPVTEDLRPEPLTRNQLLQAFNYLIKNDADFMNKLHEAYVKSFSELVS